MNLTFAPAVVVGCLTMLAHSASLAAESPLQPFPREEIHVADRGPDEALVNLRIANNRWVDCFDDATAIHDIFRIEGALDKGDQEKALALWKWFRILVSATCGGYCYETGKAGQEGPVFDPHKIFTVYGHHQCDGQSWSMVALWRAAGYMALDECHFGHTIASLRYRDADGQYRFHDLDPQRRYYHWDPGKNIIGTWTMPLLRGLVHRHVMAPQQVHDLRRSLRSGETVELLWNNQGHVIPPTKQDKTLKLLPDYVYAPGRTNGVYAAVGQETQTLVADTSPERFAQALYDGAENTAASPPAVGRAALHPARKGAPGIFVYRLPSPYVAVDAMVQATLVKGHSGDTCRLWLSRDGGAKWLPIHVQEKTGVEKVVIPLGTSARAEGKPHVYTAYDFLIKAEFASDHDEKGVGMNALAVVVYRQCNKRTLPNLMPGENCFRISFDRLAAGKLLEMTVNYSVAGRIKQVVKRAAASPLGFCIDTGAVQEKWLRNYDQAFNVGALRMESIRLRLVDAAAATADPAHPAVTDASFRQPAPHPADMTARQAVERPETDPIQTSGFFPQSRLVLHDKQAMDALVAKFQTGKEMERWVAAEDLGNYPAAIDVLLQAFPGATGDLKLHICKALAQIKDQRASKPLLEVWSRAPSGAPGTRYIPDVLAAIGDDRVVPALVAPLHRLRFDYRFHIADALGKLGGKAAGAALEDLAANDPFPAIRQHARQMLQRRGDRAPAASAKSDPATSPDGVANWPCFRGPGCGRPAPNPGDLPSPLSLERHKVFDVALALQGASSPIIWGDRIYLTGEGGRVTACDRASGKSLWDTTLHVQAPAGGPAEDDAARSSGAGGAAPTPVTDGKFVYAFFGDGVLGCVDSGRKQVWARRLVEGGPKNAYGLAASPVLYGDLVIQVIDRGMNARAEASFIVAVSAHDGAEVWRKDRPVGSCWTTPLVVHATAGDVLVTTAPPLVIAYDPRTGQERWQAKGSRNGELCISPVQCGEDLVALEASGGLTTFRVAGQGDVTNSGVVWTSDAGSPEVASPACAGGRCFLLGGETLTCLDAATGKEKWNLDLEGTFWASPVVAKDRVYAINKAGVLFVVSTEGKKLEEVKLGDAVRATPAILDGRIYIRTAGRLLCVGRP